MPTTVEAPVPATAEQVTRREHAIETSGWGRPFRLVQPHNLAFWVLAAGVLWGAWSAYDIYAPSVPVASHALLLGAVITVGYGALLWLFFRSIDRYDRLPVLLLVAAFLWGGLAAGFATAAQGNDANLGILGKVFGLGFVNDWGPGLSAPFTEEWSKAAGFLVLLTLAPELLHSPRAALVTGAFIGLGFQVLEDDLYSAQGAGQGFYADQTGSVVHMAVVRIATGWISHPAYTGLFCVGLLYVIGSPAVRRSVPKGLAFIVVAMLLHGVWDAASAIGNRHIAVIVGCLIAVNIVGAVALWLAFRNSQPYEQAWMRDILEPEIAAGHLTAEEVDAAAGTRRTRRKFIKGTHGHRAHKHAKHVLHATIDLAHEIAAAGGDETGAVAHARTEVVRLRGGQEEPAR